MNVAEAMQATDRDTRVRLLRTLHELAGENHAITLPTEVLKRIAVAYSTDESSIDFSEPGATYYMREPESISENDARAAREHMLAQEKGFRSAHERARSVLREPLIAAGGRASWPDVGSFLNEVWSRPEHLDTYLQALWEEWELPGAAPVEALLAHPAWKLFFDGWGAAFYGHALAHPQPRWAGTADLQQLIYLGIATDALLTSEDAGLQAAGSSILGGRYPMREVVSLRALTA